MSEAEKNRDGKNALLEELESIRTMLDTELATEGATDADESGSDSTEQAEAPTMPTQIPLLQDIIEADSPDDEIQLEQLRDAASSIIADQSFLDPISVALSDSQSDPEVESPVPDELYQQDDLLMLTGGAEDEAADLDETGSAYSEYQHLDEPEEPAALAGLAGLSPMQTDEFIDLLIEEHVDEILDLFKSILRDKLSLLMVQFRDSRAATEQSPGENPMTKHTDDRKLDLPDLGDEDSNWTL